MRRTRHVVLPVRSWQYIGLLIVSLACLTLGHVSRDREGRHGSLAGPELTHTAPHEVDACPNEDYTTRLLSTGSSSPLWKSALDVAPTTTSESRVTLTQVRSSRLVRDLHQELSPSRFHNDATRLISGRFREHRLGEPLMRRIRAQSLERRVFKKSRDRRVRPTEKRRDARLLSHFSEESAMRGVRSAERHVVKEIRERRVRSLERHDARLQTQSLDRASRRFSEPREIRDYRSEIGAARFQQDFVEERRVRAPKHQIIRDQHDSRTERMTSELREKRVVRRNLNREERRSTSEERRVRAAENRRVRDIEAERHVRDSRSERRSLSEERRVRSAENRRVRDTEAERRVRDSRSEQRSLSEEQRVRAADNRLDSRAERRFTAAERGVHDTKNRRVRDSEAERRVPDSRIERRSLSEKSRVRQADNRRDSRVERRIRVAENWRVRDSDLERRVRDSRTEPRLGTERRVREAKNRLESRAERTFASERRQIRVVENRSLRDAETERRVRDSRSERISTAEERRARSMENQRVADTRQFREQLKLSENDVRRVRLARSLKDVRAQVSRNEIRENRRNSFRLENRDNRMRLTRLDSRREVSQVENRALDNRLVREEMRRLFEMNRRNEAFRPEVVDSQQTEEKVRKEKRQAFGREAARLTVRDNQRRSLAARHNSNFASRRIRSASVVQLRRTVDSENRRALGGLDQRRVNEKRFDQARRERRVDERVESANLKNILMRDVRMKMMSMDPQYLKTVIPTKNLDYETLQQATVIALCAIYGASIFKGKSAPFGNFAQYASRLSVW